MSKNLKILLLGLTRLISLSVVGAVSYQLLNGDDPVEIEIGGPF